MPRGFARTTDEVCLCLGASALLRTACPPPPHAIHSRGSRQLEEGSQNRSCTGQSKDWCAHAGRASGTAVTCQRFDLPPRQGSHWSRTAEKFRGGVTRGGYSQQAIGDAQQLWLTLPPAQCQFWVVGVLKFILHFLEVECGIAKQY